MKRQSTRQIHPSRMLYCFLAAVLLFSSLGAAPARDFTFLESNVIYADSLSNGWDIYPWGSDVNDAAAAPVHSGQRSIAVTYEGAWQGLQFYHAGVNTTGFSHLRFYIHGGSSGGQQNQLRVEFSNGSGAWVAIPAAQANQWVEVKIPLSSLNAIDKLITGFAIMDAVGSAKPTFYLDNVALTDNTNPNSPTMNTATLHPRAVLADDTSQVIVRAAVTDPQGAGDIASVTLDASVLGRGVLTLQDNGLSNDGAANDGVYGVVFTVASGITSREAALVVTSRDKAGNQATRRVGTLTVLVKAGGSIPAVLPQKLSWGSNGWEEDPAGDWQSQSGVPWTYNYRYITYEWYTEGWGGNWVNRYVTTSWNRGYIPIVTVYMFFGLPSSRCDRYNEGGQCYAEKLKDPTAVQNYLNAIQEAARQAKGTKPVIFNVEPDFYGFMQQYTNQGTLPAGVRKDDPTSIAAALNKTGYPNTLAGFGRYLVDLIHTTAPNVLVAPMASAWATNMEPFQVSDAEAIQMAQRTGSFINAMGGAQADLIVAEWCDRDAGFKPQCWWDDTDRDLPRGTRHLLWENSLSKTTGKRLILWQIPLGNMNGNNSNYHYQDNKVAYAFTHPRELFDAGVAGVVFGDGADLQTQVSTDNGFFQQMGKIAYDPPASPTGLRVVQVQGDKVTLAWNENSESDIWGYRVIYQLSSGGESYSFDAQRKNTARLLLPVTGQWKVQLVAYDAMGQPSSTCTPVTFTIAALSNRSYLPAVVR